MQAREIKSVQIRKKEKVPLHAGNIILYRKKTLKTAQNTVRINKLSKVAIYKINTLNSGTFVCTK